MSIVVRRLASSTGPCVFGASAAGLSGLSMVPCEEAEGPAESASEKVGHRGSSVTLGGAGCGITRLSFCD